MEELINKIKTFFENTNSCHDFSHTERVLNLALKIAEKENGNLEILKLAALLHDVGRREEDSSKGNVCHAEKGAEIAKNLLNRYGYNEEIISKVTHCIETHRFRKEKKPESKEAMILFDADKLDSIGAIGIGRAFSFAGHLGAMIHDPDVNLETSKEYTKEDTAYREFLVKLNKIKERILTNEGKRIAEERHNFMVEFFNRINKEVKGEL